MESHNTLNILYCLHLYGVVSGLCVSCKDLTIPYVTYTLEVATSGEVTSRGVWTTTFTTVVRRRSTPEETSTESTSLWGPGIPCGKGPVGTGTFPSSYFRTGKSELCPVETTRQNHRVERVPSTRDSTRAKCPAEERGERRGGKVSTTGVPVWSICRKGDLRQSLGRRTSWVGHHPLIPLFSYQP